MKHLVVTTVYSGIIAAIFTRVKSPLLPQIIRPCTQRLPRFNIAPKWQQKSHDIHVIKKQNKKQNLAITIRSNNMSLLLLFTLAKSLRSALVSPVSMTTFLPS